MTSKLNQINRKKAIVKDILIPPIIKRLHSNLKIELFLLIKRSPLFLKNTAFVCEDCYLLMIQFEPMAGKWD